MHAEATTGFIVLTHIDKDDFKLIRVCFTQLLHNRLHLLARNAAYRPQLKHNDLAFCFRLIQYAIDVSSITARSNRQQEQYNQHRKLDSHFPSLSLSAKYTGKPLVTIAR